MTTDPADTIAELTKQLDTQRQVADAFREALNDAYRPHIEQNRAYALAITALEEQLDNLRTENRAYRELYEPNPAAGTSGITGLIQRAERAETTIAAIRDYAGILLDSFPQTGCQAHIGTHLNKILDH